MTEPFAHRCAKAIRNRKRAQGRADSERSADPTRSLGAVADGPAIRGIESQLGPRVFAANDTGIPVLSLE
jgi:hypothetical protein